MELKNNKMKNKNLMLLAGAGIVAFFLLRKKTTPTETTTPTTTTTARVKTTENPTLTQSVLKSIEKFKLPQNKFKKFNLRGRQVDGFIY